MGLSLEALQSRSERLGHWISENPTPILGTLVVILVVALVGGLVSSSQESAAIEAADELAGAQRAYRLAMGAEPAAIDIAEPANPEAARAAREAAVVDLRGLIEEHAGSPTAALAALHLGERLVELGRADEAVAAWQDASDRVGGPLGGLLLQRIATQAEQAGRLSEAADAYARASEIADYPLRYQALAESARLRAAAGESAAAIELLQQLEADAPAYALPEHVAARLRELRAAQSE
jgi:tetratricopeptide (TPR) repeat protein